MKDNDVLIWTKGGVWLQTEVDGQLRSSFVGVIGFEVAREWARARGIAFQRYPVIQVFRGGRSRESVRS